MLGRSDSSTGAEDTAAEDDAAAALTALLLFNMEPAALFPEISRGDGAEGAGAGANVEEGASSESQEGVSAIFKLC